MDSLLDLLIDMIIYIGFMIYCVQETWFLGNSLTMVQDHMVFMHNMGDKEPVSKGRVKLGVAIILSPTAVIAYREAGYKPPITTLL